MTEKQYATFLADDGKDGKNSTWIDYVSHRDFKSHTATPSSGIPRLVPGDVRLQPLQRWNCYEAHKDTHLKRNRLRKIKAYDRYYHQPSGDAWSRSMSEGGTGHASPSGTYVPVTQAERKKNQAWFDYDDDDDDDDVDWGSLNFGTGSYGSRRRTSHRAALRPVPEEYNTSAKGKGKKSWQPRVERSTERSRHSSSSSSSLPTGRTRSRPPPVDKRRIEIDPKTEPKSQGKGAAISSLPLLGSLSSDPSTIEESHVNETDASTQGIASRLSPRNISTIGNPANMMKRSDTLFLESMDKVKEKKRRKNNGMPGEGDFLSNPLANSDTDRQGLVMNSGSEIDISKSSSDAKRTRPFPARASRANNMGKEGARDPSGISASDRKKKKKRSADSSDSESVNPPFMRRFRFLAPIQQITFENNKMPKPLFARCDYMWYGQEEKIVYIARIMEGATPMFYQCKDVKGRSLLIAQNHLSLSATRDNNQADGSLLPAIDASQDVVLLTKGMKMLYMPGAAEAKEVVVLDLLRNTLPHTYVVQTEDEDRVMHTCYREHLSVPIDDRSGYFKCGACLETYDQKNDRGLVDKCNACNCTICASCNSHAYMIFNNNHCRECREKDMSITKTIADRKNEGLPVWSLLQGSQEAPGAPSDAWALPDGKEYRYEDRARSGRRRR